MVRFFYKALPMEGNIILRIDNNNNNNKRTGAVCLSVCVSVYPICAHKSRTEGHINFRFSAYVSPCICNCYFHFYIER